MIVPGMLFVHPHREVGGFFVIGVQPCGGHPSWHVVVLEITNTGSYVGTLVVNSLYQLEGFGYKLVTG